MSPYQPRPIPTMQQAVRRARMMRYFEQIEAAAPGELELHGAKSVYSFHPDNPNPEWAVLDRYAIWQQIAPGEGAEVHALFCDKTMAEAMRGEAEMIPTEIMDLDTGEKRKVSMPAKADMDAWHDGFDGNGEPTFNRPNNILADKVHETMPCQKLTKTMLRKTVKDTGLPSDQVAELMETYDAAEIAELAMAMGSKLVVDDAAQLQVALLEKLTELDDDFSMMLDELRMHTELKPVLAQVRTQLTEAGAKPAEIDEMVEEWDVHTVHRVATASKAGLDADAADRLFRWATLYHRILPEEPAALAAPGEAPLPPLRQPAPATPRVGAPAGHSRPGANS